MTDNQCPVEIIAVGHKLAGLCRPILKQTFRQGLNVKIKKNALPVTQVDLAIETIVRDYLAKARAEDGVIGEEFESHNDNADFVWIVDPIVGTNNFIAGNHGFCFVVGCTYKGKPIFGLMDQPITGDRWIGARGFAATLNDNRISIHKEDNENTPLRVAVTDKGLQNSDIKSVVEKLEQDGSFVLKGGNSTLVGLLSGGWVDAVIDDCEGLFSYLPLIPILDGAGGVLLESNGKQINEESKGILLAGSQEILKKKIIPLL